jgi:N-acetylglutamate synthase-like GNAT family acetyltransferase
MNINTLTIAIASTLGGLTVLAACVHLAKSASAIWASPVRATALTFILVWLYCCAMFALLGPGRGLGSASIGLFLLCFCVPTGAAMLMLGADLRRHLFRIPKSTTRLPSCRVRRMSESDLDVCDRIYRSNEGAHLPAGAFERFQTYVRAHWAEFVVVEAGGSVRGFGGITVPKTGPVKIATLVFGMIDPDDHRKGYGTTLLLARLASLPQPDGDCAVVLYATDRSISFYDRFGFASRSRALDPGTGVQLSGCLAQLSLKQWLECRALLHRNAVALDL